MLKKLSICNYALIDKIELNFADGLSIITGETGAGKSIMLGALSLLLGGRADSKVIRNQNNKSIIEAIFNIEKYDISNYLEENEIDNFGDELIMRREISANGRSRAFVNDTPVNLSQLGEISKKLIDIHSQHQNLLLADNRYQLHIIDSIADNKELRSDYKMQFKKYVRLYNRLQQLKNSISKYKEDEEFRRFQLEQLQKLNIKKGEQEQLERQHEILSSAEDFSEKLSNCLQLISASENSVLTQLKESKSLMSKIDLKLLECIPGEGEELLNRFESAYLEIKDISETFEQYQSKINSNPELLNKIEDRLNLIYDASRRFKVSTGDELVEIKDKLENELSSSDSIIYDKEELEKEVKTEGVNLKKLATALSETREHAADKFSSLLVEMAKPLGMHNIKFSVRTTIEKMTIDGQDKVEFNCSFNKNQQLQPISTVASGGEISRIMLCIKAIIASKMQLPTIIFDEVDTGVSGEIANKMGEMMKDIASTIQVITITHLPQVASKGTYHYKVFKTDSETSTQTEVKQLTETERLTELATMLSGSMIDEAAIKNAQSLLNQNQRQV